MPIKRWNIRQPDISQAKQLAEKMQISVVAAMVLVGRGIDTVEKTQVFLQEDACLGSAYLLKDMDKAVARIRKALSGGERIAIYGDYDCDGIMSTVLLYSYLDSVGANVCYYIPERDREGYGLNKAALELIHQDGVALVITVDNGITALDEIAYANSIGLDIVVTDHHKPREVLPQAAAVVDPHRLDDESGYEYLAGAGVAFKLVCALEEDDGEMALDQYGDLIAIATAADVVPLVGENRQIVRRGLDVLQNTNNEGISALMEACGLAGKSLSSERIVYGIVPRINSAGRFDKVDSAIELFVGTDNPQSLANEIYALNDKRRKIEEQIVNEIFAMVESNDSLLKERIIVLAGENWHHGIVGIVASKMVDRFGKPCIVLSKEGEYTRGSARSVEGFSIIDAIHACAPLLYKYGGHNQAAGMTLETEKLDAFIQAINTWACERFPDMPAKVLHVDALLSPKQLTVDVVSSLGVLEPFGAGNEVPLFSVKECKIKGIYPIGDGKHLRLRFSGSGEDFSAVYFGVTAAQFPYKVGDRVDLVASIDENEWNGEVQVSVKIKDIHLSGLDYDRMLQSEQVYFRLMRNEAVEDAVRGLSVPCRDDIAVVYRFLRGKGSVVMPDECIYASVKEQIASFCKLRISLDILEELCLITRSSIEGAQRIEVVKNPAKVDIMSSEILQRMMKKEPVAIG